MHACSCSYQGGQHQGILADGVDPAHAARVPSCGDGGAGSHEADERRDEQGELLAVDDVEAIGGSGSRHDGCWAWPSSRHTGAERCRE